MITPVERQRRRVAGQQRSPRRPLLPAQFGVIETPLAPEHVAAWQRAWDKFIAATPDHSSVIWLPRDARMNRHPTNPARGRIQRMRRHLAAKHSSFQAAEQETAMRWQLASGIITRQEFDERQGK